MSGLCIFQSHGTNTVTAATHAEAVDGDVVRSLEIEAGLAATVAAIDTDRGGCSLDDDRLVIGARAVFVQPPAAGVAAVMEQDFISRSGLGQGVFRAHG